MPLETARALKQAAEAYRVLASGKEKTSATKAIAAAAEAEAAAEARAAAAASASQGMPGADAAAAAAAPAGRGRGRGRAAPGQGGGGDPSINALRDSFVYCDTVIKEKINNEMSEFKRQTAVLLGQRDAAKVISDNLLAVVFEANDTFAANERNLEAANKDRNELRNKIYARPPLPDGTPNMTGAERTALAAADRFRAEKMASLEHNRARMIKKTEESAAAIRRVETAETAMESIQARERAFAVMFGKLTKTGSIGATFKEQKLPIVDASASKATVLDAWREERQRLTGLMRNLYSLIEREKQPCPSLPEADPGRANAVAEQAKITLVGRYRNKAALQTIADENDKKFIDRLEDIGMALKSEERPLSLPTLSNGSYKIDNNLSDIYMSYIGVAKAKNEAITAFKETNPNVRSIDELASKVDDYYARIIYVRERIANSPQALLSMSLKMGEKTSVKDINGDDLKDAGGMPITRSPANTSSFTFPRFYFIWKNSETLWNSLVLLSKSMNEFREILRAHFKLDTWLNRVSYIKTKFDSTYTDIWNVNTNSYKSEQKASGVGKFFGFTNSAGYRKGKSYRMGKSTYLIRLIQNTQKLDDPRLRILQIQDLYSDYVSDYSKSFTENVANLTSLKQMINENRLFCDDKVALYGETRYKNFKGEFEKAIFIENEAGRAKLRSENEKLETELRDLEQMLEEKSELSEAAAARATGTADSAGVVSAAAKTAEAKKPEGTFADAHAMLLRKIRSINIQLVEMSARAKIQKIMANLESLREATKTRDIAEKTAQVQAQYESDLAEYKQEKAAHDAAVEAAKTEKQEEKDKAAIITAAKEAVNAAQAAYNEALKAAAAAPSDPSKIAEAEKKRVALAAAEEGLSLANLYQYSGTKEDMERRITSAKIKEFERSIADSKSLAAAADSTAASVARGEPQTLYEAFLKGATTTAQSPPQWTTKAGLTQFGQDVLSLPGAAARAAVEVPARISITRKVSSKLTDHIITGKGLVRSAEEKKAASIRTTIDRLNIVLTKNYEKTKRTYGNIADGEDFIDMLVDELEAKIEGGGGSAPDQRTVDTIFFGTLAYYYITKTEDIFVSEETKKKLFEQGSYVFTDAFLEVSDKTDGPLDYLKAIANGEDVSTASEATQKSSAADSKARAAEQKAVSTDRAAKVANTKAEEAVNATKTAKAKLASATGNSRDKANGDLLEAQRRETETAKAAVDAAEAARAAREEWATASSEAAVAKRAAAAAAARTGAWSSTARTEIEQKAATAEAKAKEAADAATKVAAGAPASALLPWLQWLQPEKRAAVAAAVAAAPAQPKAAASAAAAAPPPPAASAAAEAGAPAEKPKAGRPPAAKAEAAEAAEAAAKGAEEAAVVVGQKAKGVQRGGQKVKGNAAAKPAEADPDAFSKPAPTVESSRLKDRAPPKIEKSMEEILQELENKWSKEIFVINQQLDDFARDVFNEERAYTVPTAAEAAAAEQPKGKAGRAPAAAAPTPKASETKARAAATKLLDKDMNDKWFKIMSDIKQTISYKFFIEDYTLEKFINKAQWHQWGDFTSSKGMVAMVVGAAQEAAAAIVVTTMWLLSGGKSIVAKVETMFTGTMKLGIATAGFLYQSSIRMANWTAGRIADFATTTAKIGAAIVTGVGRAAWTVVTKTLETLGSIVAGAINLAMSAGELLMDAAVALVKEVGELLAIGAHGMISFVSAVWGGLYSSVKYAVETVGSMAIDLVTKHPVEVALVSAACGGGLVIGSIWGLSWLATGAITVGSLALATPASVYEEGASEALAALSAAKEGFSKSALGTVTSAASAAAKTIDGSSAMSLWHRAFPSDTDKERASLKAKADSAKPAEKAEAYRKLAEFEKTTAEAAAAAAAAKAATEAEKAADKAAANGVVRRRDELKKAAEAAVASKNATPEQKADAYKALADFEETSAKEAEAKREKDIRASAEYKGLDVVKTAQALAGWNKVRDPKMRLAVKAWAADNKAAVEQELSDAHKRAVARKSRPATAEAPADEQGEAVASKLPTEKEINDKADEAVEKAKEDHDKEPDGPKKTVKKQVLDAAKAERDELKADMKGTDGDDDAKHKKLSARHTSVAERHSKAMTDLAKVAGNHEKHGEAIKKLAAKADRHHENATHVHSGVAISGKKHIKKDSAAGKRAIESHKAAHKDHSKKKVAAHVAVHHAVKSANKLKHAHEKAHPVVKSHSGKKVSHAHARKASALAWKVKSGMAHTASKISAHRRTAMKTAQKARRAPRKRGGAREFTSGEQAEAKLAEEDQIVLDAIVKEVDKDLTKISEEAEEHEKDLKAIPDPEGENPAEVSFPAKSPPPTDTEITALAQDLDPKAYAEASIINKNTAAPAPAAGGARRLTRKGGLLLKSNSTRRRNKQDKTRMNKSARRGYFNRTMRVRV